MAVVVGLVLAVYGCTGGSSPRDPDSTRSDQDDGGAAGGSGKTIPGRSRGSTQTSDPGDSTGPGQPSGGSYDHTSCLASCNRQVATCNQRIRSALDTDTGLVSDAKGDCYAKAAAAFESCPGCHEAGCDCVTAREAYLDNCDRRYDSDLAAANKRATQGWDDCASAFRDCSFSCL
jgi:hypothetical protein